MLKNYLKIAFRNLRRNKLYSTINVLGLAVGIAGAVLLYLYIDNELNYDTFHEKADQIYRIVEIEESADQETRYFGQTAPVLGATLRERFPEVKNLVRVYRPGGHVDMKWKGERIHERSWFLADSDFFEVFDFEFIYGNKKTALTQPNSLVLSKRKAEQYFGDEDPIGKALPFLEDLNESGATVTGVIENIPENSHLQFDLLFSRQITGLDWSDYLTNWEEYGAYTYLLLDESTDMASFTSKLNLFIKNQLAENENARNFYLQPITDIYFGSDEIEFGLETTRGNEFYLFIFGAIGIFLLMIAGINYMNLATALSMQRSKEIGIRKTAGAEKKQLIIQFLSESVTIALLACIFSYFLIELLLPFFNELTGKHFVIGLESVAPIAFVILSIGLILGLTSGIYPSFYLALVRPIRALKSEAGIKGGNLTLRKTLVVTQFCLSIILIICTLAAWKQIRYIQAADLGFDKKQVVVVDINSGDVRSRFQSMKQELEKVPGVLDAAASSRVPGTNAGTEQVFANPVQGSMSADSVQTYFMSFDEDMPALYDLSLTAGRNFTGNKTADSLTVLVNQTAAGTFGWENPVGQFIRLSGVEQPVRVAGVVEDFNFQSLHQKVAPLIVGYWANPVRVIDYFSIKLEDSDIPGTIAGIKEVHQQFDSVTAMEYHFLDQQIELLYENDIRAGRLFAIGGGVAIFIACMGLFGLALFSTERRVKEIGIRKVLGASVGDILRLVSTDFMKLVAVAFLVALPFGWIIMNNWLQNFAYHTTLGMEVFVTAGLGAMLVSLITISWQALKAALMNPVDSLKSE